jgi:hypothetical protein
MMILGDHKGKFCGEARTPVGLITPQRDIKWQFADTCDDSLLADGLLRYNRPRVRPD